ncbi:formate dehydrogenase accessory sulfurtransferase FdhD [Limibacter armeniacum]|uniref:formate dehydrogenase accessory sulfurtransferase FdhD n=1 Tax=Limibacter armeniacum TaxID=466084 RepID=UPI002FE61406
MNTPENTSTRQITIDRYNGVSSTHFSDILSVEEPLEIRVHYGTSSNRQQKNISVTMRTPGNDPELAAGFLFTEGIISSYSEVKDIYHGGMACQLQKENIIIIELSEDAIPNLMQTDRNFYTTSSCGVCGKSSIQSIRTISPFFQAKRPELNIPVHVLYQLPKQLKAAQSGFSKTGGIHAAGLFTLDGKPLFIREDVGRHNALDKLIGTALKCNLLPLNRHILLLSGRASFELIQKAAMAGISIVAAIGAPSSLAVELAVEFNITLIGFLKEDRFNIYNCNECISMPTHNKMGHGKRRT